MAGTAALAGTAQAQTIGITPVKACYLGGEKVTIAASGFTPNGSVTVTIDGDSLGAITADAAGTFGGTVTLGAMRGVRSHALTATDATNPALVATASYVGTTHRVTVKPDQARAGRKLRIRGRGFLAGPRVFMHVRGPGRFKADRRIARAKAPCGTFAVRRRIVPPDAATGRYRVQFDAVRRFSRKTRPRLKGTMRVFPRATGARVSLFGGASLAQRWTG